MQQMACVTKLRVGQKRLIFAGDQGEVNRMASQITNNFNVLAIHVQV